MGKATQYMITRTIKMRKDGKTFEVVFLADYLESSGTSKYNALKLEASRIGKIEGRKRFEYVYCTSGDCPAIVSDQNGVFEAFVGRQWRKVQFVDQYQKQHGFRSKELAKFRVLSGSDGLSVLLLKRPNKSQNITFAVLPNW